MIEKLKINCSKKKYEFIKSMITILSIILMVSVLSVYKFFKPDQQEEE